ncbi:MAG TPA: Trm112 family protein [Candidatus Polarisedimenticolaceae bacterium]|nr:Trm112 family protein [Candidatus Polarisedimenticolaceae bacterium]
MALSPELLEILRCPACHGRVDLAEGGLGLACGGCSRVYPIRDGIPVMIVDQATPGGTPAT